MSQLYPWQTSICEELAPENAGGRTVYWVYTYVGAIGKSYLVDYLVMHGALKVKRADEAQALKAASTRILDANQDTYNEPNERDVGLMLFYENPIVVIDLGRVESNMANPALYRMIESLQSGTLPSIKGEAVAWPAPVKIIVFANKPPDITKLSPDRWAVYTVDPITMQLVKDLDAIETTKLVSVQLAQQQTQCLQRIAQQAATNSLTSDLEKIFKMCFDAVPGAVAIKTSVMHDVLTRNGLTGVTQAEMNKWIERAYARHPYVRVTRSQNRKWWKGFALKA